MAEEKEKKYYWLKLNLDFFDREEVKLIENMPNGKEYIIFYMKLLLKSANSEGRLMFREVIPYTDEMLASITNTNIDVVRSAVKLFLSLGMMKKLDDGALFLHEVQNMIGSETVAAKKKRAYREKKKTEKIEYKDNVETTQGQTEDTQETEQGQEDGQDEDNVPFDEDNVHFHEDNVRQEKEIDIEIEKDIDTTTKIDNINYIDPELSEKEKDSSSSSNDLIKRMLEQHGISNNTKLNIMVLVREENITPERVAEVLKAAQAKKWHDGAIYQALRDKWTINLDAEQQERQRQREKSAKIDEDIKKSSQEFQAIKDKVDAERQEKEELMEYMESLPHGIQANIRNTALIRAKDKYPFGYKTMFGTLVIYEVIREYKAGTLKF